MKTAREKIVELHEDLWGSIEKKDKTDIELIADILECMQEKIDEQYDHSHNIS